jgi:hypothetical protein
LTACGYLNEDHEWVHVRCPPLRGALSLETVALWKARAEKDADYDWRSEDVLRLIELLEWVDTLRVSNYGISRPERLPALIGG